MATHQFSGYSLRQQMSSTDKQPSMAVQPYSYQPVPAQASTANFTVVQAPPTVQTLAYTERKPDNYLVFSVLSMLFCCFICGLIALIYSLKVDSSWNSGDSQGAKRAAKRAKNWNIGALVSGIIVIVLIIIGSIVGPVVAVVVAASAVGADINNAFNNALNNAGITFPTAITFPSTTPLNCFDEFGTYIC